MNNNRRYSKSNEEPEGSGALSLVLIQLLALAYLIYSLYFKEFGFSGDAAGAGMEAGFYVLFVNVPLFIFIQITNLFLIFKNQWLWGYKFFGVTSFIFTSMLFISTI